MVLTSDAIPSKGERRPKKIPAQVTFYPGGKVMWWTDDGNNGFYTVDPDAIEKAWEKLSQRRT